MATTRRKPTVVKSVLDDIEHHPLKALIPPKHRLDNYVGRKIGGIEDLDILNAALKSRHNVGIFGPTGCAKTTAVYAFGHKIGVPVFSVPCNGAADPTFLFGGYRPNPDGTFTLRPGPVYYIAKYGGINLFDEFNMLPPRIGAVLHGMLDSRRILVLPDFDGSDDLDAYGNPIESTVQLHPMCLNVATWNPAYAGTYALNAATLNRFGHKMRFDYSRTVEEDLIVSGNLLDMAAKLRVSVSNGVLRTPVSTNMLIEFEEFAGEDGLGLTYAIENFVTSFFDDEQPSVREVLRQHYDGIAADLAPEDDGSEYDDEAVDDDDFTNDSGDDD